MTDLELFTRDLMRDMENTLGTGLDWVAANHYDTATPHVHIIVSGSNDRGKRLLLPRDYINMAFAIRQSDLSHWNWGRCTSVRRHRNWRSK